MGIDERLRFAVEDEFLAEERASRINRTINRWRDPARALKRSGAGRESREGDK